MSVDTTVQSLVKAIDEADAIYYGDSAGSGISDCEYDRLKASLREIDPHNERLVRVGYNSDNFRNKVDHSIPMGSLDNTDNGIDGFSVWFEGLSHVSSPLVMASLKIDGSSVSAVYKAGRLVRVATRGNGKTGEDITANGMYFVGLPHVLNEPLDVVVRGEAILYKQDFVEICERDSIPVEERSNPRNVGNGIIVREGGKDCDRIRFLAFNIYGTDDQTESSKMFTLARLGFIPVSNRLLSKAEFRECYDEILASRDSLPYEIDGIVVSLNSIADQDSFVTGDIKSRLRPKYARAVKFPHKSNVTKLVDVLISVGHTRAIIPTAVLEEVRVGGVNVTHALLNNWDEIARLDVAIGDRVEVVLAGDIIPKIVRVVEYAEDRREISQPSACPSCGSKCTKTLRGKPAANFYCTNLDCEAAKIEKISKWIGGSKHGVGILGIGDAILKALWDSGLVRDPADLYKLNPGDIANIVLDGSVRVGQSRAEHVVSNIRSKMNLPLDVFLGSLGIDLLGNRRVKILADLSPKLSSLSGWLDDTIKYIDLPGLGDAIRSSIVNGIDENRDLIEKLLSCGVEVVSLNAVSEVEEVAGSDKPFAGMSFCLTGTRDYVADIERLGGVVKSGVSRGLTYLVQKDPLSQSSKTRKAEQYGVQIISVDYLGKVVRGEASFADEVGPDED